MHTYVHTYLRRESTRVAPDFTIGQPLKVLAHHTVNWDNEYMYVCMYVNKEQKLDKITVYVCMYVCMYVIKSKS